MMVAKNQKIAIIGGGPAGLTLAVLLQHSKFDVTVYERDSDQTARQQGATLDLHQDSGLKAIREMGLLDAFKKHYRPGADKLRVVDPALRIHYQDHAAEQGEDFDQPHFRPEIDRGPLRDMLIGALEPGTIVWNSKFLDIRPDGQGWTLDFEDIGSAYADLVVAADGAGSKVRRHLSDIEPVYSGICIVEGNIYNAKRNAPRLWELAANGKVFALDGEKSIILSVKGEGSLSFYTGTWETADWLAGCQVDFASRGSVFDWFRTRFEGWDPVWDELFQTDHSYFIPRPQYHYPLNQKWESLSNLTILGDAAHRMPPYAGEGVNMAMLDALELYQALCDEQFSTTRHAISFFEKNMCERAARVTGETLQATNHLHQAGALSWLVGTIR